MVLLRLVVLKSVVTREEVCVELALALLGHSKVAPCRALPGRRHPELLSMRVRLLSFVSLCRALPRRECLAFSSLSICRGGESELRSRIVLVQDGRGGPVPVEPDLVVLIRLAAPWLLELIILSLQSRSSLV